LLVNDDPITNYEIQERAKLLAMSANVREQAKRNFRSLVTSKRVNARLKEILNETIQANRGRTRQEVIAAFEKRKQAYGRSLQQRALSSARASAVSGLKKQARDELIDERLKLQEAKRLGIKPPEDRVEQIFNDIAQRNKMSGKQFAAHLRKVGASSASMKARFRAQLAWNLVINRRFRRLISVSQRDIDQFIDKKSDDKSVAMRLQKITIPVAANLDQRDIAQRMSEADALRQRFRGCTSTASLVRRINGAQLQDLGSVSPTKMSEPTRSMLLSAKEGDMLPPSLASGGIEMFAVCSKTSGGSLEDRLEASRDLENQELNMLGRRHLADLKRDAHIERR
jgi:peptidyl-prolyl cis-trans isomerase SurA